MCDILNICVLFCLSFVLIYGDECKNKEEGLGYIQCSVYKLELQQECPLATNDGDGNFVFYIKPLTQGQLSISLHESYGTGSSIERTGRLFSTHMLDANEWRKIKIRRGSALTHWGSWTTYHYLLEVNKQSHLQTQEDLESGNEIRVKTAVKSLWTSECDPRDYTPPQTTKATQPSPEPPQPPQTTKATQPPPDSTTPTQPLSSSLQPRVTASTITVDTKTIIIAVVLLVLIQVAILVTVILVLRHRRSNRDQALTQPSENQNRPSPAGDEPGTMPHTSQADGPGTITNAGP
ncbi:unnamed protein product, partial [Meganyctiphanes norvegica]